MVAVHTYPAGPVVTIDGVLQCEEQRVDLRWGPRGPRLYVRWAVPSTGLEFDGSQSAGQDRTHRVTVLSPSGTSLLHGDMRVAHFAVGHTAPGQRPVARAVFVRPESPRGLSGRRPPPEPTGKPDPFGYGRQTRGRVFFDTVTRDPFGYSLDGRTTQPR